VKLPAPLSGEVPGKAGLAARVGEPEVVCRLGELRKLLA
jgi:hypothetical protein